MALKRNLKPITSDFFITGLKSKLIEDGILTDSEISELVFSMNQNELLITGPQGILDKLPRGNQ